MNCGSTAAYPANECISIYGNYYNLGCKNSDTATMNTYVDPQCTQAISSQTQTLSQSNCNNGVQNTCGSQNQPPDPNQPSSGSESGSESDPCSNSAGNDDGPGKQPTKTNYAVSHTIVLQGITVAQFNSDPLIVKSFRQAIAVLLDVATTDIINVVAKAISRRVLTDTLVQHRTLDTASCR
jgi:hypothetical protein